MRGRTDFSKRGQFLMAQPSYNFGMDYGNRFKFDYSSKPPTEEQHNKAKRSLTLLRKKMKTAGRSLHRFNSNKEPNMNKDYDKRRKTQGGFGYSNINNVRESLRKDYNSRPSYTAKENIHEQRKYSKVETGDILDYELEDKKPVQRAQRKKVKQSEYHAVKKPKQKQMVDQKIDKNTRFEDIPIKKLNNEFDIPETIDEEIILYPCPEKCGRKFSKENLVKHKKVCKKVFQTKRKTFDASKQRQDDEMLEFNRKQKRKKGGKKEPVKRKFKGMAKWKLESKKLRNAIRLGRGAGPEIDKDMREVEEYEQEQMTTCKFCNRTFNDKAAQRHITFCERKFKQNKFKERPVKAKKKFSRKY